MRALVPFPGCITNRKNNYYVDNLVFRTMGLLYDLNLTAC